MKKLLVAALLLSACKSNKSIDFIKSLAPAAECEEMSEYTSVCKVPSPTKENPAAKVLYYCHASPGTKPDCEPYGAKAEQPAPTPTPFGR